MPDMSDDLSRRRVRERISDHWRRETWRVAKNWALLISAVATIAIVVWKLAR